MDIDIHPNGTLTVTGCCCVTRKLYSVTVLQSQYIKYREGALVQDAFPNIAPEDREFLVSQISPEGWKRLFGTDLE